MPPRAPRAVVFVLAGYALLAAALVSSEGMPDPVAVTLVAGAVVAWSASFIGQGATAPRVVVRAVAWSIAAGCVATAFVSPPARSLAPGASWQVFYGLNAAAAFVLATYVPELVRPVAPAWLTRARLVALVAVAAAMGAWIIVHTPQPDIDVFELNQAGAAALVHGHSPYADDAISVVDSFVRTKRIEVYPYPPVTLALSTVAYAIASDVRWAELGCLLIGAAILHALAARKSARGDALPALLAACLLFHPRGWFVIALDWIEPIALPFLGAAVLCLDMGRRMLAAVFVGLLCLTKQTLVLYVPFLLFVSGFGVRGAAIALATVIVVLLPFVATTPSTLWKNLVAFHADVPFRVDSLSIPALVFHATRAPPPRWLDFVAAAIPLAAARWIVRGAGGALAASMIAFGLFYLFAPQAFMNYYYLLDATALFAAAAWLPALDPQSVFLSVSLQHRKPTS